MSKRNSRRTGSYKVVVLKRAEKQLRKIPGRDLRKVRSAIKGLAKKPRPTQSKKLTDGVGDHRLRVGDYRVLYEIDSEVKEVIVYRVSHRKDAYRR